MKTAKRDPQHGTFFTLAIFPSDKYVPYYIKVTHWGISALIVFFATMIIFSLIVFKNNPILFSLTNDYDDARIANTLQNTKVSLAVAKHKALKEQIHKLKVQEEEIKEMLSINFDGEQNHKIDFYSYPMIATHRIISKRGEFGRVLVDNEVVVEYFDPSATPTAYQRALITAERLKSLLASKIPLKKYALKRKSEKVVALINNQVVFVVYPTDIQYLQEKVSEQDLAKKWIENIRISLLSQEDQLSLLDKIPLLNRDYRLRSKIYKVVYTTVDYPAYHAMADKESTQGAQNVDHLLKMAQQEVVLYRKSFSDLKATVQSYKTRFNFTPSISPIRGSMAISDFGWRVHPILRHVRFHTGVDIPSWYGAPIYATAAGTIVKAGWLGGYGNRIEIDHGYGFSTVYAHNESLLVDIGQYVYKGQVIAKVGTTGLSQGPHCHYEVRYFDRPVNPDRFLSLNIFTASKNW